MAWSSNQAMNAIENMHEVRFPKYYSLHIIYYIPPLTINVVFTIRAVSFFQKPDKLSVRYS